MNWRRLKVFAIVALLVLDVLFLCMILDRNRSATHYDEDVTRNALMLLREGGLTADSRFLTGKIPSSYVLSGDMAAGESALKETLSARGYLTQSAANGIRCFGLYDELFLGSAFSFTYSYLHGEENPSYLLIEGSYMDVTGERYAESAWQGVQKFLREKALLPEATERYSYEIVCDAIYVEKENYIVRMVQTIDGARIEAEALFLVRDGIVRSAEGTLITCLPEEALKAENVGLLEILFSEKEALEDGAEKTVSDIVYSFAPYFDAQRHFYLVPLCTVVYEDGTESTYNFISGKIFSGT